MSRFIGPLVFFLFFCTYIWLSRFLESYTSSISATNYLPLCSFRNCTSKVAYVLPCFIAYSTESKVVICGCDSSSWYVQPGFAVFAESALYKKQLVFRHIKQRVRGNRNPRWLLMFWCKLFGSTYVPGFSVMYSSGYVSARIRTTNDIFPSKCESLLKSEE